LRSTQICVHLALALGGLCILNYKPLGTKQMTGTRLHGFTIKASNRLNAARKWLYPRNFNYHLLGSWAE
jgi:hypothetical protein